MPAENLKLRRPLYTWLKEAGGSSVMIGDYGTATNFYYQPGADDVVVIKRMIIHIKDTAGIDADKYGNGITLTNGIHIHLIQDGETIDLLDGGTIKTNAEWAAMCHDAELKGWGQGNDIVSVRWSFDKGNQGLRLIGANNDRLQVVLQDNFEGLLGHSMNIQGEHENQYY